MFKFSASLLLAAVLFATSSSAATLRERRGIPHNHVPVNQVPTHIPLEPVPVTEAPAATGTVKGGPIVLEPSSDSADSLTPASTSIHYFGVGPVILHTDSATPSLAAREPLFPITTSTVSDAEPTATSSFSWQKGWGVGPVAWTSPSAPTDAVTVTVRDDGAEPTSSTSFSWQKGWGVGPVVWTSPSMPTDAVTVTLRDDDDAEPTSSASVSWQKGWGVGPVMWTSPSVPTDAVTVTLRDDGAEPTSTTLAWQTSWGVGPIQFTSPTVTVLPTTYSL